MPLIAAVGVSLISTGMHFTSYALTPVNYFEDSECWQRFLLERTLINECCKSKGDSVIQCCEDRREWKGRVHAKIERKLGPRPPLHRFHLYSCKCSFAANTRSIKLSSPSKKESIFFFPFRETSSQKCGEYLK